MGLLRRERRQHGHRDLRQSLGRLVKIDTHINHPQASTARMMYPDKYFLRRSPSPSPHVRAMQVIQNEAGG